MQKKSLLDHLMFWVDKEDKEELITSDGVESFAERDHGDGAHQVDVDQFNPSSALSLQHQSFYTVGMSNFKNNKDLINTYRRTMSIPEVSKAVDNIIDTAIVHEDNKKVVSLNLDDTEFSDGIRKKITDEFNNVVKLLKLKTMGTDHFKRWYVDSRIYFHNIIDPDNPSKGIIEMRRLDPRNMELIQENQVSEEDGQRVVVGTKSFFLYNTQNNNYRIGYRTYGNNTQLKIPHSAITYAHSGEYEECSDFNNIIGFLHKAIKPANQLKLLEDAMVIYRISRAPERRVFYIDTGNLPRGKSEQLMRSIMHTLRNTMSYDTKTGTVVNSRGGLTAREDLWLQRRDGKAVTEVQPLPGATGMNEIDDVKYFDKKLYLALNVPLSRMPSEGGGLSFGMGDEITRDELDFNKFVKRLQNRFSKIILSPLKQNLILKGVLTAEEWDREEENISCIFSEDSYYSEAKQLEILERRFNALNSASDLVGRFISHKTAMRDTLMMSEDEVESELNEINEERNDERINPKDAMPEGFADGFADGDEDKKIPIPGDSEETEPKNSETIKITVNKE